MSALGVLVIAFTPGLFWLWFFLRLDRVHPSPRHLIVSSFLLGMLSTIPAAIIEYFVLDTLVFEPDATLSAITVGKLAMVGPVEECSKFLAVRLGAYRSRYFDEPADGLVYSAATSLGFASLENASYVLKYGPEVMLIRAPLATVAHLVFGSLWGYSLGLRQQGRGLWVVVAGLVGAAALHNMFNFSLLTPLITPVAAPLIVLAGGLWSYKRFQWGQLVSPFRYQRNIPLTACQSCGQPIRIASAYCRFCGKRQSVVQAAQVICGNCRHVNRHDARYCTGCGDKLLR